MLKYLGRGLVHSKYSRKSSGIVVFTYEPSPQLHAHTLEASGVPSPHPSPDLLTESSPGLPLRPAWKGGPRSRHFMV